MGGEFGQWNEWSHESSLDWHLTDLPEHRGIQEWMRDLNTAYRDELALHELDFQPSGFDGVEYGHSEESVLSFLRKSSRGDLVLVLCNFTPIPRHNYRVGVPRAGRWREILNSDAKHYGGSGHGNFGGVTSVPIPCHGRWDSLNVTLPPLGVVVLRWEGA
jgi:1,4-alpha-glucan branching enzyme